MPRHAQVPESMQPVWRYVRQVLRSGENANPFSLYSGVQSVCHIMLAVDYVVEVGVHLGTRMSSCPIYYE